MNSENSSNERLNIIIADDHILLLDLLQELVQCEFEHANIKTAKNFRDLVNNLNKHTDNSLVLMDYRMPGVNGMVGIKWILSNFPQSKLLVMSGLANSSEVDEFMSLGVKGFIPKTSTPYTMICAIKLVLEGEKYLPSSHYEHQESMTSPKITPRELEVLKKLHIGYSNKLIAKSLGLQEVTIKMHISRLFKKLNSKNRTQLIIEALNHELL